MPDTRSTTTWVRITLAGCVEEIAQRVGNPAESGFARFVGLEHIETGDTAIRNWGSTNDVTSSMKVFNAGDVIVARRNVYLRRAARAGFDGVCSGDGIVLRAKAEVCLPELLPFLLNTNSFWNYVTSQADGTMSKRITVKRLLSYELALPPIAEQRRIVEACIAVEATLATLHELVAAARVAWLAAVQHFEDLYAEHTTSLGNLLEAIQPGRSVVGADRPPTDSEYGVLRVSAVDPLGFQAQESKVLLDQADFAPEHRVRAGDLLITRANTPALVGESCIVEREFPNLMLCDKTLRLVPKANVSKNVLWHMLQSSRVRQQILAVATGTGAAMKNVSQPKFKALRVCMPPSREVSEAVEARLDECRRALRDCLARRAACREVHRMLVDQVLVEGAR